MKALHCSSFLKTALLIVPLALCFGGSTVVQAGGKDPLSPGPVRPGNLDYRTELAQGYLKVYSATDKFNDGDAWYFPHSSYAIYTIGGKLFKKVKNQGSPEDEISRSHSFASWIFRGRSSIGKRRIRSRARCRPGRPADDPRLGRLGKEDAKLVRAQLTNGNSHEPI